MSEFFFVAKTVLFSALVLMILQIRVGGTTLEQHSESWIYHSSVGGEMQAVARGVLRAGYEGVDWLRFQTQQKVSEESSRERSLRSRSRSDDLE
jgi:hypothetical protein